MTPDDDLSSLIRRHATRHAAPETLQAAVRTQLALAAARSPEAVAPAPPPVAATPSSRWRAGWQRWRAGGLGFGAGVLCTVMAWPLLSAAWLALAWQPQLVSHHVRALQTGSLVDVVSSDRHTVKPWFQGRIDYAPPVLDLAAEGFPLAGGRVEHLRGEAVATLAYWRERHAIALYVWPNGDRPAGVRLASERGFNLAQWADDSMRYAVVSDLERPQLEHFVALWRQRRAQP